MYIQSIRDLMNALRQGSFSSVGSYPLYFVVADGGVLAPSTVKDNLWQIARELRDHLKNGWGDKQWVPIAHEVNWEDPTLFDDHTGERIPSAYAEPD